MLAVCDLSAFLNLGFAFPMHLLATRDPELGRTLRQTRGLLQRDFPAYANSRLCSLSAVIRHRGRNLKLFVARLCYRLRLTTALLRLRILGKRRKWRLGYW